jgi:hypothetical protein
MEPDGNDRLVQVVHQLAAAQQSRRNLLGAVGKLGLGMIAAGSGLVGWLPSGAWASGDIPNTFYCCYASCSICSTSCEVGGRVCVCYCSGNCGCPRAEANGCLNPEGQFYCTCLSC